MHLELLPTQSVHVRQAFRNLNAHRHHNLSLSDLVRLLTPASGYLNRILQDIILQLFADINNSRDFDAYADIFRRTPNFFCYSGTA